MPHVQSPAADDSFRAGWHVPITHSMHCSYISLLLPKPVTAFSSPSAVRPLPDPPSRAPTPSSLSSHPRAPLPHCCCHWQQGIPPRGWEPWRPETSAASPVADQGKVGLASACRQAGSKSTAGRPGADGPTGRCLPITEESHVSPAETSCHQPLHRCRGGHQK